MPEPVALPAIHEVAATVGDLPPGSSLVRVVALQGFGSRDATEVLVVGPDGTARLGRLLGGLADEALREHGTSAGTVEVTVTDPDADAAGLACGGRARLLVQPVSSVPEPAWSALRERQSVVLASSLATGATRAVTDAAATGTTGGDDGAVDRMARQLLRAGRSTTEVHEALLVQSFVPPTTVRIVGRAGVGEALVAQAELLGWHHETIDDADGAAAAARRQASHDALVVLSHDPEVDTPALAAALEHGRGFVGALGSRGTQQQRRERLRELGFGEEQLATIHGPVGLDLGARTPAETAVAIVAEILAHRSGRDAASLRAGDGPING